LAESERSGHEDPPHARIPDNFENMRRVAAAPTAPRRAVGTRDLGGPPCRNEAAFARRTLDSVLAQTVPPERWIIVDDGSADGTSEILDEYAAAHACIEVVRRSDRGRRAVGPGVIEAFNAGLEQVDLDDFDFLCKLDLDLDLPPRYFEILLERMQANPRLGTCSGKPYFRHPRTGELVSEKCGDETSVGMTKLYRVDCFRQIGGFVPHVMWDGIDCHRCRMLGWKACSWDEPELRFEHLRPMGASDRGWLKGRMRHGAGQHFMGTGLPYMTASALFRMTRPPLVLGGLGMWLGYLRSMLTGSPRYDDPEFRRFLRRYQWDCLVRGKRRATARLDEAQAASFDPARSFPAQGAGALHGHPLPQGRSAPRPEQPVT
jgi:glycosyltransferase involved in cell wall biosynthesis